MIDAFAVSTDIRGRRDGVELPGDPPLFFVAGRYFEIDVSFRADGGADGPENHLCDGVVGGLAYGGSGVLVFDADVVVGGAGAEAFDGGQDGLACCQFVGVVDFFAVNFGQAFQRVIGARGKGEFYGGVRAGGLAIQHVEIVFVDAGLDGLFPDVLQVVFEDQLIAVET